MQNGTDRAGTHSSGQISSLRTITIDGVDFHAVTEPETLDIISSNVRNGSDGGLVLTVNTDIMRQLHHTPDVLERARLVVADGMPLVWASWILGDQLPERVTGAEMVPLLCQRAAKDGLRVFLFGAAPGVADRAASKLQQASPGLQIVGTHSPERGFDATPEGLQRAVDLVAETRPDVVFVALGFPRQERLALAMLEALPKAWFIGCGGALDMAAGDVPRAHTLVQRLGAEWLHRLFQEPRRLSGRYLRHGVPYTLSLLGRSVATRLRGGRPLS